MKDILGFESLYAITDLGEVFSKGEGASNNSFPRKLKPYVTGKCRNYQSVRLYKEGRKYDFRVHRLVAQHFIDNPHNYPSVHHIDEDTSNNHVSNLQWCTDQYNKEFSSSRRISLRNPEGQIVEIFNLSKFCRDVGMSNGSLYLLLSGKYKQSKGWTTI